MRRFFTLAISLWACLLFAYAKPVKIGNLYYNLDTEKKTAAVTKNNASKYSGNIVIPSSVQYYGFTYTVATIENYAFITCDNLTSVTIPSSVTKIGSDVFRGCEKITSFTVNADNPNYCSIEGVLFTKDKKTLLLYPAAKKNNYYIVPDGVTNIGDVSAYAFFYCKNLTSITIPKSVTCIHDGTFNGCKNLYVILVDDKNQKYTSIDGVLFSKDFKKLYRFPEGKTNTSYTIPNSVKTIEDFAFYGCKNITSITIPKHITRIGVGAFYGCKELRSVILPDSLGRIATGTFSDCINLTSISIPSGIINISDDFYNCNSLNDINVSADNPEYCSINGVLFSKNKKKIIKYPAGKKASSYVIPNGVTLIDEEAFRGSSNLTSITIPNTVKDIRYRAFMDCNRLASITIPNGIKKLDSSTFENCSSLTSITIPQDVKEFGFSVFDGCNKLSAIYVASENQTYCSINGVLFSKDKKKLIRYPEGKTNTSYVIPNSVTEFGHHAFSGCKNLTSVTIPKGIIKISANTFADCTNLTSVTCQATTPPTMNKEAFENVNLSMVTLNVPVESENDYKSASGWKRFKNNLSTASTSTTTTTSASSARSFPYTYYYELSNGKGDGHYITITAKSCYDSDSEGISIENGLRLYQGAQNNQQEYYGLSFWGNAHYYFSIDYTSLKVVTDDGKTYNYTRKNPTADAVLSHGQVPERQEEEYHYHYHPTTVIPTYSTYPTTTTNGDNSTPSQTHRPCAGCGGSGMCTMCNGKGWYTYYGSTHTCSSCGGSGRCRVCHGKGHCN